MQYSQYIGRYQRMHVDKREEEKRDAMESEVSFQRIQIKYKYETELLDECLALPGFSSFPCKIGSSEEEFVDLDGMASSRPHMHPTVRQNQSLDSKVVMISGGSLRQELRRQHVPQGWLHKMDPLEPVLLFTRPLDPEKLVAAGIVPQSDNSAMKHGPSSSSSRFGLSGGRIVYDRWDPLLLTPIQWAENSFYMPPKPRPSSTHN